VTHFEREVYKAVLGIPLGEVRTYKWVAASIGHPRAVRAVGQALKKNPYRLIIPCHRVVSCGKGLGGYSGGVDLKRYLLNLERQIKELVV